MTQVQITIEDMAGAPAGKTVKIVHVVGQLDETNVDEEAKNIYQVLEAVPQGLSLIFDFSGLEYMNSKSIGYLTDWYSKISGTGGQVVIAAARDNILDILQVVGLTQLINSYATLEEAKLAVSQ
jgi:stage II sporulation protein AA (anti-sigma F factor antagonist)